MRTDPVTALTVPDVLRRAEQVIAERGWCQEDFTNDLGQVCCLGAIHVAAGGTPFDEDLNAEEGRIAWAAASCVADEAVDGGYDAALAAVADWNDEQARERIASQVEGIRHWQLIEGDYAAAPNIEATWFIDPPYVDTGYRYRFGSRLIDYPALSVWCRTRAGQVMVCEHVGADWLPFHPFMSAKSTAGKRRDGVSKEALWTNAELQDDLLAHLGATA